MCLHEKVSQEQAAASGRLSGERRSKKRYALLLPVTYRIGKKPLITTGRGRTIDMSSTGIAFTSDEYVNAGTDVELSIHWPIPLDDICPLNLLVKGKVVRSTGDVTAMAIEQMDFRTRGRLNGAASESI